MRNATKPNLVAQRDIKDHIFFHTGDAMKLERISVFRVKIKKRVFFEGEPGNTCRNYPNSEFSSYKECDHKFMKTKVEEIAPGLMPVWMTEDLRKVTTEPMVSLMNETSKYESAISIFDWTYTYMSYHCRAL